MKPPFSYGFPIVFHSSLRRTHRKKHHRSPAPSGTVSASGPVCPAEATVRRKRRAQGLRIWRELETLLRKKGGFRKLTKPSNSYTHIVGDILLLGHIECLGMNYSRDIHILNVWLGWSFGIYITSWYILSYWIIYNHNLGHIYIYTCTTTVGLGSLLNHLIVIRI